MRMRYHSKLIMPRCACASEGLWTVWVSFLLQLSHGHTDKVYPDHAKRLRRRLSEDRARALDGLGSI